MSRPTLHAPLRPSLPPLVQVWLLRSSRGKVTGPFTGHQLHDMLNRDEVPEDSLCKQEGWKAWKAIEEVEVRRARGMAMSTQQGPVPALSTRVEICRSSPQAFDTVLQPSQPGPSTLPTHLSSSLVSLFLPL